MGVDNTGTLRTCHICVLRDDVLAVDAGALTSHLSASGLTRLRAVLFTRTHSDYIRDIPGLAINHYLSLIS